MTAFSYAKPEPIVVMVPGWLKAMTMKHRFGLRHPALRARHSRRRARRQRGRWSKLPPAPFHLAPPQGWRFRPGGSAPSGFECVRHDSVEVAWTADATADPESFPPLADDTEATLRNLRGY